MENKNCSKPPTRQFHIVSQCFQPFTHSLQDLQPQRCARRLQNLGTEELSSWGILSHLGSPVVTMAVSIRYGTALNTEMVIHDVMMSSMTWMILGQHFRKLPYCSPTASGIVQRREWSHQKHFLGLNPPKIIVPVSIGCIPRWLCLKMEIKTPFNMATLLATMMANLWIWGFSNCQNPNFASLEPCFLQLLGSAN